MGKTQTRIVDETSLYDGLKNLSTSYYDTVAQFNQAGKKKGHFSFQTLRDLDWKTAVTKLIGSERIGQVTEGGKTVLKKGAKVIVEGLLTATNPEVGAVQYAVGQLTELVIDKAVDRFTQEDVWEQYEQGKWIYIDRGKEHNKLRSAIEMAAETSMFQDSDEILQQDEARQLFSPGFYVSHVSRTDEHIVYAFDTEDSITVDKTKIRPVAPGDELRFDQDSGMTNIRELFFHRQQLDNIQYTKFQVGDEVRYKANDYVVTKIDQETAYLKDSFNKVLEVDPQACTAGPRDHWTAQEPSQFRTVSFTFGVGDFAYRPVGPEDYPPVKERAKGVMCCIFYFDGSDVEVFDCWTGERTVVKPNRLVKPPLVVRQYTDNQDFHTFKYRIVKKLDPQHIRLGLRSQYEEVCWGYDMVLPFVDTRVLSSNMLQTEVPMPLAEEEVKVTMKQVYTKPDPPVNQIPTNLWVAGGLILAGILIL